MGIESSNEQIDNNIHSPEIQLTSLENKVDQRSPSVELVDILNKLDESTSYDIDIELQGDDKFLIINNNILKIPLTTEQIKSVGEKIVDLLNQEDPLLLVGDKWNRGIADKRFAGLGYSTKLDAKKNGLKKSQIEEIFKFLSYIKGEDITAENIHSDICFNGDKTEACVNEYK